MILALQDMKGAKGGISVTAVYVCVRYIYRTFTQSDIEEVHVIKC